MVLLNRELSFPIALYQAFTLPLIPTAYNLLVGLRFIFAAPMAVVYLGLFLVNAFTRSDFPREANSFLIVSYAFTTLGSLIANFRVEHAERVNFLQMWRSRLSDTLARHANRRLTMLARTDALTGIANRREFDARMIVEFAKAESTGKPLAVIVLDIDNFKLYNDGHGHPEGDKCIRLVARAISEGAGGPPDLVSRIGGEEFAVVLPNAAVERAAAIAQQIRIAVAALQLPHPALGDRRVVTVSLGVACLNPARPETPEAVIGRADAALYRAKRGGRDRAEVELRVVNA